MGLREKLNQQPKLAAGIGVGALVLGVLFMYHQSTGGSSSKAYFSDDDGQTWFAADVNNIPPFDHNGKEAVRAYVFECKGGKRFVNHLERATPEGRKMMQAVVDAARAGKPMPPTGGGASVLEVKKPGAKDWVPEGNIIKAGPILNAHCPDGGGTEAVPVEP